MAFMSNRKICVFCENSDQTINYKEFKLLRKFITDQGKIIPGHVKRSAHFALKGNAKNRAQGFYRQWLQDNYLEYPMNGLKTVI